MVEDDEHRCNRMANRFQSDNPLEDAKPFTASCEWNPEKIRGWLNPSGGNLVDRLLKTEESGALANELYLAVFTRYPSEPEVARVTQYLADRGDQRTEAVQEMVWALLASAEFRFNH